MRPARAPAVSAPGPNRAGVHSFHNGVDIAAAASTSVYPVVSGTVVRARPGQIVVRTGDGRTFQYYHLDSAVHSGQYVVAQRTIIGKVGKVLPRPPRGDRQLPRAQPLAPVTLRLTGTGRSRSPPGSIDAEEGLRARRRSRAGARDTASSSRHRPSGSGQPLTSRFRAFRKVPVPGRVAAVPRRNLHRLRVAVDFPSDSSAAWLLARLRGGHLPEHPGLRASVLSATPGRYLFRLGLDASRLAAGSYRPSPVTDIRRNSSVSSWPLRIARAGAPAL
jgi:hypothetical protein